MMISPLHFYLVAEKRSDNEYYIPATGDNVGTLSAKERLCVQTSEGDQPNPIYGDNLEQTLYIRSLNQVRRCFRGKLVMTYALAVFMWIALIVSAWSASMAYYEEGMVWYRFLPISVFVFLSCLYTVQALRPVIHDSSGIWINLRNGSSNLEGGCRIRRVKEQSK